MTFTATFENYDDMMDFAMKMVGVTAPKPVPVQTIVTPVQPEPQPSYTAPSTPPVTTAPQSVYAASTAPVQQQTYADPPAAPVQQPAYAAPAAPVPTSAPSYTLDDLTRAAIPLMDSGKQPALLQLLKDFGVEALPLLRQEQFGAFATALRGLGAQI